MSPGVTAVIFPHGPGRAVYNKALLAGGLSAAEQSAALETMAAAYADAGVSHYAAWVHETETALREDLEQCDYTVESSTRAMGMTLSHLHDPRPTLPAATLPWREYVRQIGLAHVLLAGANNRCDGDA